jgi:LysM repeat protein
MNRFWTRLEAKGGTANPQRDPARHYQWAWTGSLFGLITALVVVVPVIVAVLLLTEFSILVGDDADEVVVVNVPSDSDVSAADSGGGDLSLFPGGGFDPLATPAEPVPTDADLIAADPQVVYTVVAGDTLSIIATQFDTSVDALVAFNAIANRNALRLGQQIAIPPADYVPPPPPSVDDATTDSTTGALPVEGVPIDLAGAAEPTGPQ